jgi:hypothetical protein
MMETEVPMQHTTEVKTPWLAGVVEGVGSFLNRLEHQYPESVYAQARQRFRKIRGDQPKEIAQSEGMRWMEFENNVDAVGRQVGASVGDVIWNVVSWPFRGGDPSKANLFSEKARTEFKMHDMVGTVGNREKPDSAKVSRIVLNITQGGFKQIGE